LTDNSCSSNARGEDNRIRRNRNRAKLAGSRDPSDRDIYGYKGRYRAKLTGSLDPGQKYRTFATDRNRTKLAGSLNTRSEYVSVSCY
jgi:hypothetical protein